MEEVLQRVIALHQDVRTRRTKTISDSTMGTRLAQIIGLWQKSRYCRAIPVDIRDKIDGLFHTLMTLSVKTSLCSGYRQALDTLVPLLVVAQRWPDDDTALNCINALQTFQLHPSVSEEALTLFRDGHYAEAVFEATKVLTNRVKGRSRCHNLDGEKLMAHVFNENDPLLKLTPLMTQSERDQQHGYRFLFMGAMSGIRNPKAHDNVRLEDPVRAAELLVLVSLLTKHVDAAEVRQKEQD